MSDREVRAGSDVAALVSEAITRCASGLARFVAASGRPPTETVELVRAVFLAAAQEARADREALGAGRLFGAARRRVAQAAERARREGVPAWGGGHGDPLRAIRPTEREALLARYVGGLPWADVAVACGSDEATVKERVSRALLQLTRTSPSDAPAAAEVQAMRRAVERRLADVVDGLAPDDMADFAVEDDATRDVVHDAEQAIGMLRATLAAYAIDVAALEHDVLAALATGVVAPAEIPPVAASPEPMPAVPLASGHTEPKPAASEPAASGRTEPTPRAAGPAPHEPLPSAEAKPEGTAAPGAEERAAPAAPATRVVGSEKAEAIPLMERLGKRGRFAVAAGAALLLAGVVFGLGRSGGGGAEDAWSGKVDDVSRAGDGLERCAPDRGACTAVHRGDDVPAGSTLRTDERTRAVVLLSDGTRVVLDQSTEFALDGSAPRRARLASGAAILDVAELGASRARVDAPLGYAETSGAKLSLSVASNGVDMEVVRGAARLIDSQERGVLVRSGESGRLDPGAPPEVFATSVFGGSLRWGERAFSRETESADIAGLGELKAQKPGQAEEQKGAVTLTSHVTKVRISGNVARTEIEEEFANGTDDVLEGIYRFPLPPDAHIERLALDVDGKMVDGAFVDRERAAAIWRGAIVNAGGKKPAGEEIVWVPGPWRDPALLEWQRGGRFELRIYPIPKRGSRRVVLAYTQVLAPSGNTRRYVYPLPAAGGTGTRVGRFDLDVQVRGHDPNTKVVTRGYALRDDDRENGVRGFAMTAQNFEPSGDLTIEYALPGPRSEVTAWAYQPGPDEYSGASLGASSSRDLVGTPADRLAESSGGAPYVALALRPRLPHAADEQRRGFAVIVDSSRSMFGERYRRASELAARVVSEMDPGDRATVLACDSTCVELPGGLAAAGSGLGDAAAAFLERITPEGGSDVTGAVRAARRALSSLPEGAARIVYVGDGTPTIGAVVPAFVSREIQSAVPRAAGTVTTVPIGADADTATLQTIAEAGGGALVPYVPGRGLREAAYAVLGATYGSTLEGPELDLPDGLVEAAPAKLPTLLSGSEALVTFRMTKPVVEGTITLRGKVLGKPFEQRYPLKIEPTTSKGNAFVPRLWAAAQIADHEKRPDAPSKQRAVRLSQQFHVASRYTSLLVLESAAMFQAFGLERRERGAEWTGEEETSSTVAESELDVAKDDAVAATGPAYPESPARSAPKAKRARAEDLADFADDYGGGSGSSLGGFPGGRAGSGEVARRAPPAAAQPAPAKPYPAEPFPVQPAPAPRGEGAPFAPPPPMASVPPRDAEKKQEIAADEDIPLRSAPRPPRRLIPMRKIWERTAKIVTPVDQPAVTTEAILAAERAAQGDIARAPLKKLYALYYRSGDVERAGLVAERWSAKDPLDPDALTARADIAAARGDRDLAIRILGSVVDVRPGDHKAQWRLARLHRWAGRAELGCRHSSAVAQIRSTDAKVVAEAVRCARDVGHAELASDLLSSADDATRAAADRLLGEPAADPSVLNGDLTLQATWEGGDDLDLSMLEPDGYRVSWLGAPTKAIISARDVASTSRESLALKGSSVGDYVVEITRPRGHTGTVRGSLQIHAAGDNRTVPFVLEGGRTRVALIKVSSRSRLVPL